MIIIKILSWNVRGLGNRDCKRMLKEIVQRSKADLVLVQESKLESVNHSIISKISSFPRISWVFLHSIGTAGGIIICWNKDSIMEIDSRVDRFSTTLLVVRCGESQRWSITVVYGPTDGSLFPDFLVELDMLWLSFDNPWCIGGDFNEVLFSNERSRGGRRTRGTKLFGDFVDKYNLLDVPCPSPRFTWSNF